MSNIKKFIHKKEEEKRTNFQANINVELNDRLRAKLKREGIEIRQFIEGAARAYLEEK